MTEEHSRRHASRLPSESSKRPPLVSVVIPSFNGRDLLDTCLRALAQALTRMPPNSVETIVVDDCSSDGTAGWLAWEWGHVTCVRLAQNRGFAGAANAGIAAASGEWVAVLNNDTAVSPDWMSEAAKHFDDGETACVASKVIDGRTGETESAGDGYTIAGLAHQRRESPIAANGDAYRTFSACAAAAFYRRSALQEAGAFDERLESYYEDVDLGFRLNLSGWRTVCEPNSVVRHTRGGSYGRRSWKTVRNSARNSEVVYFSCMPRGLLFRSLPSHLLAVAAQAVLRTTQGRLIPFMSGKVAFLAQLPAVARRRRRIQRGARPECCADVLQLIDTNWFSVHVTGRSRKSRNDKLPPAAAHVPPEPV